MKFFLNEVNGEYRVDAPLTGDDIIAQAELILTDRLTRPSYELFQSPDDVNLFGAAPGRS